jgi:adenylate cyclase
LLFGDIRGFSRISERLTPRESMELVSAVMEAAAACVRAEQGVLVDFIGDGLLAMWGAPRPQPDHAAAAARAACAMTLAVDALGADWEARIGEPVRLTVGLNSGPAQVGNTGSSSKFKYGPLGNSVNVASRVQGATKHLLTPVLITEATHARLDSTFCRRRLPLVRVINIDEPLRLYELCAHPCAEWNSLCREYDEALMAYERGDLTETVKRMGALLARYPNDGPSLVLIARALDDLVRGGDRANTVVNLPSK